MIYDSWKETSLDKEEGGRVRDSVCCTTIVTELQRDLVRRNLG